MVMRYTKTLRDIRKILLVFIAGLFVSGVTAFPIESELRLANEWMHVLKWDNIFSKWITTTYHGIRETNARYSFISYGTDWLAFAHIVLAILFIGPLRDPIKNIWVIEFGIIACLSIFPLAFIAGSFRGIPFFWQLIDCSFGLVGGFLLWRCHYLITKLTMEKNST